MFPKLQTKVKLALAPWVDSDAEGLCDQCTEVAKDVFETGRRVIWDNLPSYFDLPKWEDLKDFAD